MTTRASHYHRHSSSVIVSASLDIKGASEADFDSPPKILILGQLKGKVQKNQSKTSMKREKVFAR